MLSSFHSCRSPHTARRVLAGARISLLATEAKAAKTQLAAKTAEVERLEKQLTTEQDEAFASNSGAMHCDLGFFSLPLLH